MEQGMPGNRRQFKATDRRLEALRGGQPARAVTAGVVAGQSANTKCGLLTVANAAGVTLDRMLDGTRWRVPFGQASSAIARGRAFERMVKADDYRELLRLLRDEMAFDVSAARLVNLRAEFPFDPKDPYRQLRARERRTRELIDTALGGEPSAPNLVDGAILRIELGNQVGYLETDALALRFQGPIRVGEIKSFPIVDGRSDPEKIGAAMDQVAVYVLALQDTIAALGGNQEADVSTEILLIAARNTGMTPVLYRHDVGRRVAHHRRELAGAPDVDALLARIPVGLSFPPPGDGDPVPALEQLVHQTGNAYVPDCLSFCGLARWCRHRSHAAGDPVRLGSNVVRLLPGVSDLRRALELADGTPPQPTEAPAAQLLRNAALLAEQSVPDRGTRRRRA